MAIPFSDAGTIARRLGDRLVECDASEGQANGIAGSDIRPGISGYLKRHLDPRSDFFAHCCLFVLSPVILLMLVVNPGLFSHDELQRIDHVLRYGLADYMRSYIQFPMRVGLGFPVRPLSFIWQGVASLAYPNYVFLIHLADVLMHAFSACLLFRLIKRVLSDRTLAWRASLIFLVSPLATYSIGWPAALMDRLYVLFGLMMLLAAHAYVIRQGGGWRLLAAFAASTLAILSKETAVMLAAAPLFVFLLGTPVSVRRVGVVVAACALPFLLFGVYRLLALQGYVSPAGHDPYAVTIRNIPPNLLVYFSYPFLLELGEASGWVFVRPGEFVFAVACQFVLMAALYIRFGWRAAAAYAAGYFLFLLPVLPVESKGAHYLYGSAVAMSVALGALVAPRSSQDYGPAGAALAFAIAGLLALTVAHSMFSQQQIYRIGVCMNSALASLESVYLSSGKPAVLKVRAEHDAPFHILARLATGREQIGTYYPVRIVPLPEGDRAGQDAGYRFSKNCLVYRDDSYNAGGR